MSDQTGDIPNTLEIVIVAPLFPMGQLVATPAAIDALERAAENGLDYLGRHASGDWGTLDEEDKETNDDALTHGGKLLSAYVLSTGEKLWLITEADRSATTILTPADY